MAPPQEEIVDTDFDTTLDGEAPEADEAQVALLLDAEGALTPKFEAILRRIFLLYASPTSPSSSSSTAAPEEADDKYDVFSNARTLNRQDCDKFAEATNGHPMTEETWTEICDFFDIYEESVVAEKNGEGKEEEEDVVKEALADEKPTHEKARLTFKGFLQLYQLQTENDATETINDLTSWGYSLNVEKEIIEKVEKKEEETVTAEKKTETEGISEKKVEVAKK